MSNLNDNLDTRLRDIHLDLAVGLQSEVPEDYALALSVAGERTKALVVESQIAILKRAKEDPEYMQEVGDEDVEEAVLVSWIG